MGTQVNCPPLERRIDARGTRGDVHYFETYTERVSHGNMNARTIRPMPESTDACGHGGEKTGGIRGALELAVPPRFQSMNRCGCLLK